MHQSANPENSPPELIPVLMEFIKVFIHRSMRDFVQYARQNGLSMSQIGALFHLNRQGECAVSEISEEIGVSNAAASQMLDRLVEQGLITRVENPLDRRAKQIALTDKGRQIVEGGIQARYSWLESVPRQMTPAEQETVAAALNILIKNVETFERSNVNHE